MYLRLNITLLIDPCLLTSVVGQLLHVELELLLEPLVVLAQLLNLLPQVKVLA